MNAERTSPNQAGKLIGFPLGQVTMTCCVEAYVVAGRIDPFRYLGRHARGDWGDLCESDKNANDQALHLGNRLMSSYKVDADLTLWIITEWDRSVTTLLLPSEY